MANKTLKKGLWLIGGIIFLLLAVIGLMLPAVPQLIFFICSIICFMEFSDRFHTWVHKQKWFERIKKHIPRRFHRKKDPHQADL